MIIKRQNVLETKYNRVKYTLTFEGADGKQLETQSLRWGDHAVFPTPIPSDPDGMRFAGWYYLDSKGQRVSVSPDTFVMPVSNLRLQALFLPKEVQVSFDSCGGTSVPQQSVGYGSTAKRPEDPVRGGFTFGGWYCLDGESAMPVRPSFSALLSASQTASAPKPFSFDTPITANTQLFASWIRNEASEPVAWTVRHVAADGTVLCTEVHEGYVGDTVAAWALPASRRGRWAYASGIGTTRTLSSDPASNVVEFLYTAEPVRTYVVRFVDAATSQSLAGDRIVVVRDALVNASAEDIAGYVVRNGGMGYLVAGEDGTATLTFLYDRAPESVPGAPGMPGAGQSTTQVSGTAGRKVFGGRHAVMPASCGEAVPDAEAPIRSASVKTAGAHALPQTGDTTNAAPVAGLGVLGTVLAAFGIGSRRRRHE